MSGSSNTRVLFILHLAVFLAGWTGIFGRLISLGGLPLVWYRIMVSVVSLSMVLAFMGRFHKVGVKAFLKIAGCGAILAMHWVAFFASIQASNVSIGVACVATSCFFTTIFNPLINRKRISWAEVLISFMAIAGVLLIFSLDVRYRLGIALGLLCAALYARLFPTDSITPLKTDYLWLFLLGSIFTVLPFLFQLQALRKLSAFTVNLAYNLEPIYSIAIAAMLFGELQEVNFSFWLGISLIVISVIIQTLRIRRV